MLAFTACFARFPLCSPLLFPLILCLLEMASEQYCQATSCSRSYARLWDTVVLIRIFTSFTFIVRLLKQGDEDFAWTILPCLHPSFIHVTVDFGKLIFSYLCLLKVTCLIYALVVFKLL